MQIESVRRQPVELLQSSFRRRPKALNSVDVAVVNGKLIAHMINTKMFLETNINQSVIAAPAVRMNHRLRLDAPANNRLQRFLRAVRDNLRVNRTVTLEDAEDNRFARCAASALAAHTTRSEVTFINFNNSAERRSPFTLLGDAKANFQIDLVDRFSSQTNQFRCFSGSQIKSKIANIWRVLRSLILERR